MKTYKVGLTKSYLVTINARNIKEARHLAEFYTGDITDISDEKDRKTGKFQIEEIECTLNEAFDTEEI